MSHRQESNEPQATSSIDGTEEDLLSYWSDSAASNCDRISTSPTAYGVTKTISSHHPSGCPPSTTSSTQETEGEDNKALSLSSRATSSKRCNNNGGKNVRKREMANERERERTKSLNQALEILRNRLPVPEAEKRSKIQTLLMAREYIKFLNKFLTQHEHANEHSNDSSSQSIQHQYSRALNSNQVDPQQPDSPLTYKFYKFRLKSQTKSD